jgi:phenylacetate-CoA ligase
MISEVAGRADDLRKIRGVLFTPVSVEELLREEFPGIEEFEIVLERKGAMDEIITLRVEPKEEMESSTLAKLSERLKIKTLLRFNITFALPADLPRHTQKSRRFKDLRRAQRGEG